MPDAMACDSRQNVRVIRPHGVGEQKADGFLEDADARNAPCPSSRLWRLRAPISQNVAPNPSIMLRKMTPPGAIDNLGKKTRGT